ncbi:hypothetical protein FH972_023793 [Carpinus fangiana]|uniref:Uncharacterized protein n=1 Tax=Carpinus fangiana TaxID=176857 RepID=A0A5N6KWV7_9ROSI|nr:hypothetical protein FH972_023793 [Carpinus fangiana]
MASQIGPHTLPAEPERINKLKTWPAAPWGPKRGLCRAHSTTLVDAVMVATKRNEVRAPRSTIEIQRATFDARLASRAKLAPIKTKVRIADARTRTNRGP